VTTPNFIYFFDPNRKRLYTLNARDEVAELSTDKGVNSLRKKLGNVNRLYYDPLVKDMYIKYAGKWLSPDIILNIPRSIVLLEESSPNNDEPGVFISSRLGCSKESPSTMGIDVSMATRPDLSLFDVVYRLDKKDHPIFNV
jgi:hypothetical protein